MLRDLSEWLERISSRWVVLIALVIFLLFTALVLPRQASSAASTAGDAGSPDMSFFYSPRDLYGMAEAYGSQGRVDYVRARFTFDLIWPLVYTFFLATAISWVNRRDPVEGAPPAEPDTRIRRGLRLPGEHFDVAGDAAVSPAHSHRGVAGAAVHVSEVDIGVRQLSGTGDGRRGGGCAMAEGPLTCIVTLRMRLSACEKTPSPYSVGVFLACAPNQKSKSAWARWCLGLLGGEQRAAQKDAVCPVVARVT